MNYEQETLYFFAQIKGLAEEKPKYPLKTYGGLRTENLALWEEAFLRAKRICKWDNDQAIEIFNILMRGEAAHFIDKQKFKTMEEGLNLLKRKFYAQTSFIDKMERLRNLRKDYNQTIEDYITTFNNAVTEVELCGDTTLDAVCKGEILRNCLPKAYQVHFIERGALLFEDIIIEAQRFEAKEKLLNKTKDKSLPRNFKTKFDVFHKNNIPLTKKFCNYHQTSTHNDAECYSQDRRKSVKVKQAETYSKDHKAGESSTPRRSERLYTKSKVGAIGQHNSAIENYFEIPDYTYATSQPQVNNKQCIITGNIKDKEVSILVDSGSTLTLVSKRFAENTMPKLHENTYLTLADGSKHEAKMKSDFVLNLPGIAPWKLQATVLDNPIFDVILGGLELAKAKAKIDYKNNVVELFGKIFTFQSKKESSQEYSYNL